MKIALVHELLTMRGGAEKVLRILADMFPDAPIYTLLYDEKKLGDWFPKERVKPNPVLLSATRYPLPASFRFNHHLHLRQCPKAIESWDFSEFDLVISTSSAFVHGIITNSAPKHLCYVHSPARYLWDRTHDVLKQAGKGPLGWLKKKYLERTFHRLRIWDSESADRPDKLLAASKIVQRRIELYWRRGSEVVYPPIDDYWFDANRESRIASRSRSSFIIASSLVRYKRIDLAIAACNALSLPLTIVGEGPDRARLQKLSGPTITFAGYATQEELREYYSAARAVIFPGDEDFGLVPLEAMACGTPVIALKRGGALETMLEGETGEFFDEPTSESLQKVLQNFDHKKYSEETMINQAKKFSRAEFERKIREAVAGMK